MPTRDAAVKETYLEQRRAVTGSLVRHVVRADAPTQFRLVQQCVLGHRDTACK
jgi:Arc/MetJ family transcription regulator